MKLEALPRRTRELERRLRLRSRNRLVPRHDPIGRSAALVRPRPRVVLRVRPRGGGALLPAGGGARPGVRDGLVGRRVRRRTLLQQAVGEVRPGRPGAHARHGARRRPSRARPGHGRRADRAGARRGARPALSVIRARRLRPLERRLRRRDARGVPVAPGRPRRDRAVRRSAAEPHPLGVVEPGDRRAGRGRRHRGGRRSAGADARRAGRGRRARPPRPPAHAHPRPGDVPDARARAPRRGPPARARARRRPPAAHAHPHRHPVRVLPGHRRLERERRGRRPQALRARPQPRRLAHAVVRAQLPLHALRGDVPRSRAGRDGGDARHGGGHRGVGAPGGEPADGRLAGGVRGDAGARARALRPVARDPRHAVPRRSRALLRDHRDAALRPGARARGAGRRAGGAGGAGAVRGRGGPGARFAHRVQQHLRRHPCHRGRDAARGDHLPHGRSRRRVRAPEEGDRPLRGSPLRRALGLDAAAPARARRAPAGAGPGRGGGGRLPGRPRARRHRAPAVPAPGERVEPARVPRVPGASREGGGGPTRRAAAHAGAGPDRRGRRVLVPVPARLRFLPPRE